ncbi:pyridoxine kinase [Arcanobacterium wilhelmae]|uniref:pyridoxal kinase n=1 Tax=Arcanobacterium wilhelmae TaxID=1803177 RepID=A0ABT9NBW9_9ACTO|nr:pyridoxamine kinase [Arcanobacterium wilhelmae]MDP9801182.1 pyridoxine kinase [Arcanobacterium wilhelmae]WFN90534.1 pyridoxamine kinase [Arcanobacterium wilhelmae]
MAYNRILSIQDISGVGQCSLTVALPILSACGQETSILPSAVLSTHTGGFTGYTFRDLTDDMPAIEAHWKKEVLDFAALYTGYLGSEKQIDYVKSIADSLLREGAPFIVDPAMADAGKLYPGFDEAFAKAMGRLAFSADIILPNITEACLITETEYREDYDRAFINELLAKLTERGAKTVILTGISYSPETTGVVVFENGEYAYYEHERLERGSHGTGDVYSSTFVGALMNGHSVFDSARIAADFTLRCIKRTHTLDNHWYGPAFEPELGWLINELAK